MGGSHFERVLSCYKSIRYKKSHLGKHLLLDPRDIVISDVYQVIQLMDVELIILDDVSRPLADLRVT